MSKITKKFEETQDIAGIWFDEIEFSRSRNYEHRPVKVDDKPLEIYLKLNGTNMVRARYNQLPFVKWRKGAIYLSLLTKDEKVPATSYIICEDGGIYVRGFNLDKDFTIEVAWELSLFIRKECEALE